MDALMLFIMFLCLGVVVLILIIGNKVASPIFNRREKVGRSWWEKVKAKVGKNTAKKRVMKKAGPKKTAKKLASKEATDVRLGIKKEHPKSKNVCVVTFRLPKIAAPDAKSVCIVGDFNDWNIHANRMEKLKNGDYTVKLELERGREYQFRYLIDETKWENDWNADKYVKSAYGDSDNSVIML